jgi:hypothetical protein
MKVGDLVRLLSPEPRTGQHLGLGPNQLAIITSMFESAAGYTVCVLRSADKENKEVRILDIDLEVVNASG